MKNHFLFFLTCLILISSDILGQNKYTINGYVKDISDGESLIGASIFVSEINGGVITNSYGFYSLTLQEGEYNIEYRYLGYKNITKKILLDSNQKLDVELIGENIELENIIIKEEFEDSNVSGSEMSTLKLDIRKINEIPAFLGEVDLIKAIQLLPGISTVGEGASGFNVRGGSVGQNLVLLDEAPVYNSSHLLGFFSVFNPDAVKDIKLFKGAIPSRYGGRLSSILDIRMKEGNIKKTSFSGGIGTVFSRLTLESPIVKDKASFILALRRSYIDFLARPFFPKIFGDGAALNFYDITAKTNVNINDNNRIYLSGYWGRDRFLFSKNNGFNWGNKTGTLRWNHLFHEKLFSNFIAIYSNYEYQLLFGNDDENKFEWDSKIETLNLKPELTYFINTNNELSIGGEILLYRFEPANAFGVSDGEVNDITLPKKYALETGIYIGNKQNIKRLSIDYGLRFSLFNYIGPGTTYEFSTSSIRGINRKIPLSESQVEKWETISSYTNLEPRFAFNYKINSSNSIKWSYSRMSQNIHLISNTTASSSLDVWIPSTNNIKPEKGNIFGLGYFKNFLNNNIESSIEIYYKNLQNQIDYIDGADILINKYLEGDLLYGKGRAYGIEFFAKKKSGKLNGWISYTLARSEVKINGINNFEWYPRRYDQTHNLKLTSSIKINKRILLSGNFIFLTGPPITFPTSKYVIQGFVIPHNGKNSRNDIRISNYHRLDISLTIKGKEVNKKGKIRKNKNSLIFGIYNLYNRRNLFSVYFSQGDSLVTNTKVPGQATRLSIIGSIVPAIGYNFKI